MPPNLAQEPLKIVKAHDLFLAIEKPPGLSFHSTRDQDGVVQTLHAMSDEGLLPQGERIFPVHRLDRVTSGLLLFARGRPAARELGNAFRHNRIEKVYAALSDRKPHKKQGQIIGDMTRGRRGTWILSRQKKNPAITRFTSQAIPGRRPGLRLYLLRPKTGRTHQIRVALKSIGAPILGDPLYGRFDLAREEDRTYLHAMGLRFSIGGEMHTLFSRPSPGVEFQSREFQRVIDAFGDPFEAKS